MEEYSTRQQKISRLIQKELSEYFRKEAKNVFGGRMISVTVVRVTKDLALARCYLSVFPSNEVEGFVKEINGITKNIRFAVGQRVGKQLRVVPEFEFFVDDSLDYVEKIDQLLK